MAREIIAHGGGLSFHARSSKLSRADGFTIRVNRDPLRKEAVTALEKIYFYYFYSIGENKSIRRRVLGGAHKSAKLRERQRRNAGAVDSETIAEQWCTAHRESVESLEVGNALVARGNRGLRREYAMGDDAREFRGTPRGPFCPPPNFRKDRPDSSRAFTRSPRF